MTEQLRMAIQVTIDFEGFVDGVVSEGGAGKDYPLTLGSNTFIPGFEEQLVGKSLEEEVEVNVTFPDTSSRLRHPMLPSSRRCWLEIPRMPTTCKMPPMTRDQFVAADDLGIEAQAENQESKLLKETL